MKSIFHRFTALLMCAVMLLTVVPYTAATVSAATATTAPTLAYVPLDDRPVVVDRVIYGAGSAGFDIVLPPDASWYQTHLDNQLVNEDNPNTQYTDERQVGNGAAFMDWLEEMEADGCNYYIIHLDMMFSGGLVGSRYPDTHYDADGYLNISEQLAIAERLTTLANNPENHVYFVDTVMRLASTSGFKGYEGSMYDTIRAYAKQARYDLNEIYWETTNYETACKILVDPNDSIYRFYSVGVNWATLDNYGLTDEQIKLYHLARQRKMRLINYMMQYATSSYYIIGVDDASPENTIQTNDIDFIHARMKAMGIGYSLFADTDSAGLMALSRLVTDYYNDTAIPVKVRYYGDMADKPADGYDIGTLRTNVQSHVECANGVVTDGTGEVELLVLTKISDSHTIQGNGASTTYVNNINALVAQAKANIANNVPTIVVDCSTEANYRSSWVKGRTDAANYKNLQDELLNNVEISKLLGYSNWNTVGNTLGIAIGQGMARYGYLANETNIAGTSHRAFLQAMTYAYIKDITYNARNKMSDYTWQFQWWIANEISIYNKANGTSYTNMNFYEYMFKRDGNKDSGACKDWELCDGEHQINNELHWSMMRGGDATAYTGCGQQVLNAIMAGEIYTDLGGVVTTMGITNITLGNFRCPWYRQFEITFDIEVALDLYTVGTFLTGISASETASVFASQAGAQFGATATVKTPSGDIAADDAKVGTGFTVTVNNKTYTVVVYGDVDANGKCNTTDIRDVMKNVLGSVTYSAAQTEAADHDKNGKVTSTDARRLLQDLL